MYQRVLTDTTVLELAVLVFLASKKRVKLPQTIRKVAGATRTALSKQGVRSVSRIDE